MILFQFSIVANATTVHFPFINSATRSIAVQRVVFIRHLWVHSILIPTLILSVAAFILWKCVGSPEGMVGISLPEASPLVVAGIATLVEVAPLVTPLTATLKKNQETLG